MSHRQIQVLVVMVLVALGVWCILDPPEPKKKPERRIHLITRWLWKEV
jgi:hypothetical protein